MFYTIGEVYMAWDYRLDLSGAGYRGQLCASAIEAGCLLPAGDRELFVDR